MKLLTAMALRDVRATYGNRWLVINGVPQAWNRLTVYESTVDGERCVIETTDEDAAVAALLNDVTP